MKHFKLRTISRKILADMHTPVSIYLKLRDQYANSILLESSEYHSRENSFSYICCQPIATFIAESGINTQNFPDGSMIRQLIDDKNTLTDLLDWFIQCFATSTDPQSNHLQNGLFGYLTYDAVRYSEDIELQTRENTHLFLPDVHYSIFRYVIVVDHYKNLLYLYEHLDAEDTHAIPSLERIVATINNRDIPTYRFSIQGKEISNLTDDEYLEIVNKGKVHCRRGDVFQIVLSRAFRQSFLGDEFNVYRALRSVNPSPYLFYFDYGNFKLFGSSPEAQLTVHGDVAAIHPIAGTYQRTGDLETDKALSLMLREDPKENAEHIMLVDLARNDLSRNAKGVSVETFCELQYYSHVIHMVSKVTGHVANSDILQLFTSTFPAGTLTGAPKYKAMELIDRYECSGRGFYGGTIGFIGFDKSINHAIMIRTFCSQNNVLTYQAGAGVVDRSVPENELEEVNHKITALRKAIRQAIQL